MFSKTFQKNIGMKKNTRGFTLVEMLVSIAIFALILTVILGTIVTVVDVNRKSRTMSEMMNNLNFALESMTRTIKTATKIEYVYSGNKRIEVIDQNDRCVIYRLATDNSGKIERGKNQNSNACGDINSYSPITSEDVVISDLYFEEIKGIDGLGDQPRILISVSGHSDAPRNSGSEFHIQTTVSQRQLIIP